jgi:hypothetical protein
MSVASYVVYMYCFVSSFESPACLFTLCHIHIALLDTFRALRARDVAVK